MFKDGWHKSKRRENSLFFFSLNILKRHRTAANFSLNKDGGVFNTSNISESQQTGLKHARIDVSCHVMCFVWSWNENSHIQTRIRCPSIQSQNIYAEQNIDV
jgi:hypothetical protein